MAGTDILRKAKVANSYKNGGITVAVPPSGYKRPDDPTVQTFSNLDNVEDRLTNKFDDTTYYTA